MHVTFVIELWRYALLCKGSLFDVTCSLTVFGNCSAAHRNPHCLMADKESYAYPLDI